MCGIAGYFDGDRDKDMLLSMISQLEHRGPDGFGYYIDDQAGLAHARLSIIDLESGSQPMSNEDGTVWVSFNGEIYNYIELRNILEEHGHIFSTTSDTEVIVHAYEEYGTDCFASLNGQFAIALWDSTRKIGYLVRDRVGIQPLFYAKDDKTHYFASEVKALFANPKLNQGLLKEEVANVFTFWSTSKNKSVFNGVREVPPGTFTVFRMNFMPSTHTYWDHDYTQRSHVRPINHYMNNSVDLRMRSDVPVAAYLSGGLDSSIIAKLASEKTYKLNTFSIKFDDVQYDESKYQEMMAKKLGVNHTSFTCSNDDIANSFNDVIFHTEKPVFRTAPAPMFLLSKKVKEAGYKVVLTGEGADEVFAGYDIFRETFVRHQMLKSNDLDPIYINQLLIGLYPWMSDKMLTSNTDYLKLFFGQGSRNTSIFHFSHEPRIKSSSKSHRFFNENMSAMPPELFFSHIPNNHTCDSDYISKAQYIEFLTLFNGYLISSQGDRMLMAHGVEGRFPFLDPNVVDFGNSLPFASKIKVDEKGNMEEKYILKIYGHDLDIPGHITNRKKQPYMAPDVNAFIKNGQWHDSVNEAFLHDYGYFDLKKVAILQKKFLLGKATGFAENMAFIGMLSTHMLHEQMVENFSPKPTANLNRFQVKVDK